MSTDDDKPQTREELIRAREDIQRQLDILLHPLRAGRNRSLEAKLDGMVKDVDECLAAMGADHRQGS
jgi:hypothetical protein